ncbi:hypothetical protein KP79_PYT06897 [Mizuhopecten yessoensis]|uniref:Uncharacterized protein n=1 Tax=Mizuhopecten yessoensis TaxID=6573 RepID=A0A210Q7R6_MIZYE|nr:hypothetical protein KP79_PYT06897 [Mizuhopecten yessoensis]
MLGIRKVPDMEKVLIKEWEIAMAVRSRQTTGVLTKHIRIVDMMKDLRDKQRPMISMLDDFLTPEKHDTWKQFLNLMEGIVHIPRGSLEKAKDIKDIMFILKTEGYYKTRIQAHTCLMKIIRRIDSNFARKVDPIFKNIVKLDQKSKAIKGLAEKEMTEDETVFQAGQVLCTCALHQNQSI